MLSLIVNGDRQEAKNGSTIADLVSSLNLQATRVAVERNERIVPRADHATTELADGDVLEIVHFVGGG